MKKYLKYLCFVLIGFTITLSIMYINNKNNKLNKVKTNNQMAVFIEEDGKYKVSKTIPTSGYEFNEERSFCNNGATPTWNSVSNSLKLSNLTKDKTSCMLYFDITGSKKVLANLKREENKETVDFSNIDETEHLDSTGQTQMFKAEDDFGESYYFRGKVKDNWVKFGTDEKNQPIWWRIIRVNGDGSIRLIYAGTGTDAKNLTTDGYVGNSSSQIGTSYWAVDLNTYKDNMYFGYEWSSGKMHGKGTKSKALQNLNTWFKTNLKDEFADGEGQIDIESIFCNDRSGNNNEKYEETYNDVGGIGTTITYYGAYKRLYNKENPTFKCSTNYSNPNNLNGVTNKEADSFTYVGASTGTKSLTYPVGLITADEVVYAGGLYSSANSAFYLYTGDSCWTMSPFNFDGTYPRVCILNSNGSVNRAIVYGDLNLRPVINLKSTTEFKTNPDSEDLPGTINNPYIVE